MQKLAFGLVILSALVLGGMHVRERESPQVSVTPSTRAFQILKNAPAPALAWPLEEGERREKKLTFGLYVTPDPGENPIDPPERFTGYHTALDLEIFPEEENSEVSVRAACDGTVLRTDEVPGYGGVIVQSCLVNDEEATVLFGHLDFRRFKVKIGDAVETGTELAVLGEHKSEESGHTRKHLHLGVHKGLEIELRGYVLDQKELEHYIDPLPLLEGN